MRPYDVVSGILFILSIIGFALAAPVTVQEKRQACVDVVHVPNDVMTVLEKRVNDSEKIMEELYKAAGKPVETSDTHASSGSAPPRPDHGSTNVAQAPAPNPAWSTANPDPLIEPSGPSSSPAPKQGDDELHAAGPPYTPTSTEHGLDHELTGAHAPQPNPRKRPLSYWNYYQWPPTRRPAPPKEFGQAHGNQVGHVQQPNLGPSTDSDSEWNHWMNYEDPWSPTRRPAPLKEFGQVHENQAEHVQPNPGPSTDSDIDWNHWMNYEYPWSPTRRPAPPKEFGQAPESQVEPVQQPNPGPSTDLVFDWKKWAPWRFHEDSPPPSTKGG